MDPIFDRIANLFRSLFADDPFDSDSYEKTKHQYYDPDYQDAWDELDSFLHEGKREGTGSTHGKYRTDDRQQSYDRKKESEQELLKTDYANLEIAFKTPFIEVKKAYKRLLRIYHPDRFAANPQKLKIATEITKKINESYNRIRAFEKKNGNPEA